jgi:CheY-like chemotaxis protein
MGGVELISRSRALRPNLEAVMITGYATSESLLAALAAGATDYLTKPFDDLKVVRAKIRAALERRVQKLKERDHTRALAKDAQAMLAAGRDVRDQTWEALDRAFSEYEAAIRKGGEGQVLVQGRLETISVLAAAGIKAYRQGDPGTIDAVPAVLVLDTAHPTWHEEADAAAAAGTVDVLLLAGPEAGLPELLEALTMHLDLVGFGLTNEAGLQLVPQKVRALLLQRAVLKAQAQLTRALEAFRAALQQKA